MSDMEGENNKKCILIFSLAYFPYVGGAEIAIKEITNRLPEYEFDMVTLRFNSALPRHEKIGNVSLYRIGFGKKNPTPRDMVSFPLYINKILFSITAFFKAISLHRKRKYKMVWPVLLYAGWPALFFSFFYPQVPYLFTIQDGDTPEYLTRRARIRLFTPFLRASFRRATLVQAISQYLADFSKKMGTKKTVVIPNGVDINIFKSILSENDRTVERQKLGIAENEIAVISVSRLVPKNGIADLINSLAHLPKYIKLVLVGEGPLQKELTELTHTLSLTDRVIFLGKKTQGETARLLECADIFCRPSLSEGLGNVFLEAMAISLPTLGTAVGGIPDFLIHHKTGWIVESNNPKSIADTVLYVSAKEHEKEVETIIKNGYDLVTQNYTWESVAERICAVIGSLI